MSVQTPSSTGTAGGYESYDDERGYGWVVFAGVIMLILGTLNLIEGIAAISKAHFFVANTNYVIGNLNTWGWVATCIGVAQLAIGLGIFAKNQFSRWAGVTILAVNAIHALLMMPAYPLWSVCIFAMDILATYGLIAYGSRISES